MKLNLIEALVHVAVYGLPQKYTYSSKLTNMKQPDIRIVHFFNQLSI